MFHNYFFLRRLAPDLHQSLVDKRLLTCFSQNKEELILGFADATHEIYLRANLSPQVGLIQTTTDFKRARKNSADIFPDLIGQKVKRVEVFSYERSFFLELESGDYLIFKMHGSRSNILHSHNQVVVSMFRNQFPGDLDLTPTNLHQHPDLSKDRFEACEGEIKSFLPAAGKEIRAELDRQGYQHMSLSSRWDYWNQLVQVLENGPWKLYGGDHPHLSLFDETIPPTLETSNTLEACNLLFDLFSRNYYLNQEKQKALQVLNQQSRKTENYLIKTREKLELVQNRRGYDELANIIMANLHAITTGQTETELFDFYRNENISIKLKPDTSPQKFAENLYRKSKNQKLEISNLKENIATRQEQLNKLQEQLQEITDSDSIKGIRNLQPEKSNSKPTQQLPYHRFVVEKFEIFVGKNAKANDELTLKVSHKDDLWLHARDVPGSHVIIRQQAGKNIPKTVLERAAELAAWYSKRKNDSLCPVIYTPRKYIRKIKGTPAGMVKVEKEDVIMVTPVGP